MSSHTSARCIAKRPRSFAAVALVLAAATGGRAADHPRGRSSPSPSPAAGAAVTVARGKFPETSVEESRFRIFAGKTLDEQVRFEPERGSRFGDRSCDARLGDRSEQAVRTEIARLSANLTELLAFEDRLLLPESRLDRALLESDLRARLFDLEERKVYERSPAAYEAAFSLLPLALQDRAGNGADRATAAVSRLREIRKRVDQARVGVRHASREDVEEGERSFRNGLRFLERNVPAAFDAPDESAVRGEAAAAASAYRAYLAELSVKRAAGDWETETPSEEWVRKRLTYGSWIDSPVDRLVQVTELELRALQGELSACADKIAVRRTLANLFARIDSDAPTDAEAATEAAAIAGGVRAFLLTSDLRALAPAEKPGAAAPPAAVAGFLTLGNAERSGARSTDLLWVSGAFQSRARTKLFVLRELFPGGAVVEQACRRVPSRVRRELGAAAFIAGFSGIALDWALEAGYGASDPLLRSEKIRLEIVRCCRAVVALRQSAGGMERGEARAFFEREAFLSRTEAAREAEQAAADLDVAIPAIARLQMKKLVGQARAEAKRNGSPFSEPELLLRMLKNGALPVRLQRIALSLEGPTL